MKAVHEIYFHGMLSRLFHDFFMAAFSWQQFMKRSYIAIFVELKHLVQTIALCEALVV